MKYSYLVGAGLALMLSACAGTAPMAPTAADSATSGQQSAGPRDPVLAAFEENLPQGATVGSASVRQLNSAIKRTLIVHPEMSGDLAASLVEAAPGRRKMIKKAVAAARAAYVRPTGRSGKR
ncbi:hypothetical protein [Dongia sp.]|uniref:hypothetical protein n=1 Tax=Dongia sp. TaxID=1977262 RepID=UPI0035ADB920